MEVKITLVGDSSVGKTELLNSYLEHYFSKKDAVSSNKGE